MRPLASQFDDRKQKVLAVGRISPRAAVSERINNSNLVSRKWDHRELIHDFAATRTHRSSRPDST